MPPVATPADDEQLTLAEAEAMALSFQPAIREAAARVRAAHGIGCRWAWSDPEIGYAGNEIGNTGTAGQQGGIVMQEFVTAGKLDLNRAVALREKAAAEQRLAPCTVPSHHDDPQVLLRMLGGRSCPGHREQLNGIAAKFLDMSQKRHAIAKTLAEASVLQSEIESESTDLLVEQATQRRDAARRRLAAAIGCQNELPGNLEDVFARELPDLDFDTIRDRILQDSPALAELRFAVDRAMGCAAGIGRARAERECASRRTIRQRRAGYDRQRASEHADPRARSQPRRDCRRFAWLTAAQAALEALELSVQQQLTIALRNYNTARERVKRYNDKIKPAAEKSLKYTNQGFEGNQIDYAQAYNVQQTYSAKSLSYVQDLETAWQQWAEIDGFLLGEMRQAELTPQAKPRKMERTVATSSSRPV